MDFVSAAAANVALRPRPKRRPINANSRLVNGLIFEIGDGGRESTVGRHVGISKELQPQPKRNGFGKGFILENAVANDLAIDVDEHFVFARAQNVDAREFRLLMKLFGTKLNRVAVSKTLRLGERRFEIHLFEQL